MRQLLSAVMAIALVLAACGGGTTDGSGGGGGGGGGGAGDLPAPSTVIFGSAYDPASFTVTGKTGTIKTGTPVVAVGRAFTPRPGAEIVVQVGSGATNKPPRPPAAVNNPESADTFAFDLTADALPPGTWVISFTTPAGKIVASGYLVVTP